MIFYQFDHWIIWSIRTFDQFNYLANLINGTIWPIGQIRAFDNFVTFDNLINIRLTLSFSNILKLHFHYNYPDINLGGEAFHFPFLPFVWTVTALWPINLTFPLIHFRVRLTELLSACQVEKMLVESDQVIKLLDCPNQD